MIEILWNGRGGQGSFTAAKMLGTAWALQSTQSFALAFPAFGPERRGAPVRAFTKLSNHPIVNRSEISKGDYIVYLDDTLFNESALDSLKATGKILLNTTKQYSDERIITIDATGIANTILHLPITNTAMLGALSALCKDITLSALEEAIRNSMPKRLVDSNIKVLLSAKEALS